MNDVKALFDTITQQNLSEGVACWQEHDKGHGRVEERSVLSADLSVYPLASLKKFKGIKSVVRVNSVVERQGRQSQEYRYYISSYAIDAKQQGKTIRAHWEIENSLPYVLDVIYDEDDNRSRKDHLAANFSALRKMCLNILRSYKKDRKTTKSIAGRALINPSFAFDLIQKSGLVTD